MHDVDLGFSRLAMGTHQTPWDLRLLLFNGAAKMRRNRAAALLYEGRLGALREDRIPLVRSFHEAISAMVSLGKSRSLIEGSLEVLWRFFAWADDRQEEISEETTLELFKRWTEYQIHRAYVKKEVTATYAYRQSSKLANLIARALKLPGNKPGGNLLRQTRMRKPPATKRVLGVNADKQSLEHTFQFGRDLSKICETLDLSTVRGRLPISIPLDNQVSLTLAGNLIEPHLNLEKIKNPVVRRNAEKPRAPLSDDESLFARHKRSGILNLRIEAELLIFVAQTGMNLTQAAGLEREHYRWRSNGEDLEVFRIYKARRSGDVVFRCYKAYRAHLKRYLAWLDDTGFSDFDGRLFPLLSRGMIRAKTSKVKFYTAKKEFKRINRPFIGPQELRKTRVNWLLRRSRDPNLTAEQAAHDKEVLLRDYERPHHQAAVVEIINFHSATDPTISPPGPGVCIDEECKPSPVADSPVEAPQPDCISPEGCLFCTNHRDIMSADYCWKLASHARLKSIEATLDSPSQKKDIHPSYRVIDRIAQKLEAIASGSEIRAAWVKDSQDSIRAGTYHPYWDGHIRLLETIA